MAHRIIAGALITVLLAMIHFPAAATVSGGAPDAVSSTTIPLPAGNYATLNLLGSAVHGPQTNQSFVVTYTDGTATTFTQSLSDWWGAPQNYTGESVVSTMPYMITPTGATLGVTVYVYGYSFALNSAKTVQSLTLPANRDVVILAVDVGNAVSATGLSSVNLSATANVYAITNNGTGAIDGGWDNSGYAYSSSLLGTSVTYAGSTVALGAGGTANAVSSTTVPLPTGNYTTLSLLGSAVHGSQTNQSFVVTYTDGTTTKFTQSLSDWWGPPQNYAGESQVLRVPYLVTPSGATLNEVVFVYGYTFAINSAKTLKSLTLPANRNVVVLAVDVSAGATSVRVNLASVDNVVGIVSNGTAAANGGWDNSGYAYSASLLGTLITSAGTTFTLSAPRSATPLVSQTLQISGTPATTAEVGQFYSFTPTVVASAGSSLTYAVANMPAWAQFSAATGTLSGTPSTGGAATDANIVVSVSNGAQSAALPAFNITVQSAPFTTAGTATVSWSEPTENTNGSPLTNLAGYAIRYGTSSTALNTEVSVTSAAATSVEIANLSPGNWYFEVAAINTANVESQFSAIVGKTIQ
jgi:truncated hemoglobin YjbI